MLGIAIVCDLILSSSFSRQSHMVSAPYKVCRFEIVHLLILSNDR
jgi:hypothetical protein